MTIRDISTRFDCAFAAAAMPCAAVSAADDAAGDRLPLVFDDGRDDNDAPSPRRAAVVRRSLDDHDPSTQRRHDISAASANGGRSRRTRTPTAVTVRRRASATGAWRSYCGRRREPSASRAAPAPSMCRPDKNEKRSARTWP